MRDYRSIGETAIGLAVDIGTSVVKVAAFDSAGRLLTTARCDAPVLRPQPGFSEYNPETVWRAVCDAVGDVTGKLGSDVDRIAVTAQGDGCWLIGEDGAALGNAVLWNDGRAGAIVETWERDGTAARVFAQNGSALFPGAQAAILRWLQDHDPERLERATSVLFCGGWLTHRLTGVIASDRSDASLPWLDIRTRSYSREILDVLGMRWVERLLPPLCDDAAVSGQLTSQAARDLGLEQGIPVVRAPFDCVAMALGAGVTAPGDTLVVLGTTLIVESVISQVDTDGEPRGMTLCTGLPDTWLRLFGTLSGTDSLNWMTNVLGLDSARAYIADAERSPSGARGLRVLPYFSPAGERAPFIDPSARAAILGLSLDHNGSDMARAHLEGLTLALRHCLEETASDPRELVICGGGAASPFWCGLIADVTGVRTRRIPDVELGALGADLVARAALGRGPLVALTTGDEGEAAEYVHQPDQARRDLYDAMYTQFHLLRSQAEPTWRTLAGRPA